MEAEIVCSKSDANLNDRLQELMRKGFEPTKISGTSDQMCILMIKE